MLKQAIIWWESASYLGATKTELPELKRSIVLTNRLAMVLSIFPLFYTAMIIASNRSGISITLEFSAAFLSILLLNHLQFFNISRLVLSLIAPLGIIVFSVWAKVHATLLYDYNYLSPRIGILGGSVIPFILFRLEEKGWLFFSSIVGLLSLLLYDSLHNAFGVGYHQMGFSMAGYGYLNYSFIINQFVIIAAAIALKWEIERSQKVNHKLLYNLEQQNQEIQSQSEELNANQEKLKEAILIIEKQKIELLSNNSDLVLDIKEKESHLIDANRELITHNERLKQFSYGISHNLRAPVARVLGLAELLKLDYSAHLLTMLTNSARELDDVVKDFNRVIDLGNDIYSVKEKVSLQEEWIKVRSFLASSLGQIENTEIECDFTRCPVVFSIRPLISNIMYNLISNSIKFREPARKLKVSFASHEDHDSVFLVIRDNGIGFNEEEVKNNMFKMYKRFHTHVTGKGLGLYLVKTQVELLNGAIEVSSKKNAGATFTISLPKAKELEYQLCFENEGSVIYFNAVINATGIRWKKNVALAELKETYLKCLEITRAYNTSSWIWEQNERHNFDPENIRWVMEQILPEAIKHGLKKIAVISKGFSNEQSELPIEQIKAAARKTGYDVNFYATAEKSFSWLSGQFISSHSPAE